MSSPELDREPVDSDAAGRAVPGVAVHLQPAFLAVVALGGALGTGAREGVSLLVPSSGEFPVAILLINLSGAFLLGLLLDALARRGPDVGRRRFARLLLGTGFCGGFTTYSSLATATAVLLTDSATGTAVLYALITVLGGAVASWAGILCGSLIKADR